MALYDVTTDSTGTVDTDGAYGTLIKITDNIIAVAYMTGTGAAGPGEVKTYNIATDSVIDTLEFDGTQARYPQIFSIDSTHFGIVYTGPGNDGFIKTFSHSSGTSITLVNTNEFDTTLFFYPGYAEIDSDHLIVAGYNGSSEYDVRTFSISGAYVTAQIDSHTIAGAGTANKNIIVKASATKFVGAFVQNDSDVLLTTYTLDGSYNITNVDTLEIAITGIGIDVNVISIDETHFMVIYAINNVNYTIKTYSVDSGNDNITLVDTYNDATAQASDNSMVLLDSSTVAIVRRDENSDLDIDVVTVDGSYDITVESETILVTGTLNIGLLNSMVMLSGSTLAITYQEGGQPYHLYAKTVTVDMGVTPSSGNFISIF